MTFNGTKYRFGMVVLGLLLILSLFPSNSYTVEKDQQNGSIQLNSTSLLQPKSKIELDYVSSPQIMISGNAEFATMASSEGWVGDGSEGNPYIIDNINITLTDQSTGIYIENTDVYFIIQHSLISGTNQGTGVDFNNVTNSVVTNTTFVNLYYTYRMDNSDSGRFEHNTINMTRTYGIDYSDSTNQVIHNNTFNFNDNQQSYAVRGIVENFQITNNTFFNYSPDYYGNHTKHGLFLNTRGNNTINYNKAYGSNVLSLSGTLIEHYVQYEVKENYINDEPLMFYQNRQGLTIDQQYAQIIVVNSSDVVIKNQDMYDIYDAIHVAYGQNVTITDNILRSAERGINVYSPDRDSNTSIFNNQFLYTYQGIFGVAWNISVYENEFISNRRYGMFITMYGSHVYNNDFNNSNYNGIYYLSGSNNVIENNLFYNSGRGGISLSGGINATIVNNEFIGDGFSNWNRPYLVEDMTQTLVENNTINGKRLVFLQHVSDVVINDSDIGQLTLVNATNVLVEDLEIQNTVSWAVGLFFTYNTTILNSQFNRTNWGVHSIYSDDNTISNNEFYNNFKGIKLHQISNNYLIEFNNFTTTGDYSSYSHIDLYYGDNHTIRYNNFTSNTDPVLGLQINSLVANSSVYYNNFFGDGFDGVMDNGADNLFHHNYWVGWTSPDTNNDGIVDDPYPITGGNQDLYPRVDWRRTIEGPTFIDTVEYIDGIFELTWEQVNDSYNIGVSYNLYISSDQESWQEIATDLTGTSYLFNTQTVEDSITNYFMIEAFDGYEVIGTAVSSNYVIDNSDPVVNSPDDIEYYESMTGNTITWTASDLTPNNYNIYQDGTLIDSGPWDSNISISVDSLQPGEYNFTIVVFDAYGRSATDEVMVTVSEVPDTTPPELTSPQDISYTEGETGNEIVWEVIDDNPDNYSIFMDQVLHDSGMIPNDGLISFNVDNLDVGMYNVTILAFDTNGLHSSDTVIVEVQEDSSDDSDDDRDDDNVGFLSTEIILTGLSISFIVVMRALRNKYSR